MKMFAGDKHPRLTITRVSNGSVTCKSDFELS